VRNKTPWGNLKDKFRSLRDLPDWQRLAVECAKDLREIEGFEYRLVDGPRSLCDLRLSGLIDVATGKSLKTNRGASVVRLDIRGYGQTKELPNGEILPPRKVRHPANPHLSGEPGDTDNRVGHLRHLFLTDVKDAVRLKHGITEHEGYEGWRTDSWWLGEWVHALAWNEKRGCLELDACAFLETAIQRSIEYCHKMIAEEERRAELKAREAPVFAWENVTIEILTPTLARITLKGQPPEDKQPFQLELAHAQKPDQPHKAWWILCHFALRGGYIRGKDRDAIARLGKLNTLQQRLKRLRDPLAKQVPGAEPVDAILPTRDHGYKTIFTLSVNESQREDIQAEVGRYL
jgi:hypothetical protein